MNKLLKGKLIEWKSEKGFGFIQPDDGSKNIFIHISDFKEKGFVPYAGEVIFYKVGKGSEGKEKAIDAYSNRRQSNHVGLSRGRRERSYRKRSFLNVRYIFLILVSIFIMIGGFLKNSNPSQNNVFRIETNERQAYVDTDTEGIDVFLKEIDEFISEQEARSKNNFYKNTDKKIAKEFTKQQHYIHVKKTKNKLPTRKVYMCDGRKYCSQMTSCEEAKYFLNHCPDPRMDGDGDGVPCERQWCGH